MQTVILAGGLGTRLGALTAKIPKPMIQVAGRPFLEYQLRLLARQNFHDVLLLTGYLGEQIEDYFGNGSRLGLSIRYSREPKPLGTGGALRAARRLLADRFLLLYGDSLLPIEYSTVTHRLKDSAALGVVVAYRDRTGETNVRPNLALGRSGLVTHYDKCGSCDAFLDHVEAGASCFHKEVLELMPGRRALSFEQCVFPQLVRRQRLAGLPTQQRFYDIGTPERLRVIEELLRWSPESIAPDATYCYR